MKTKKQIEARLREFKEERLRLTRIDSQYTIRNLKKKIEELEWVLED